VLTKLWHSVPVHAGSWDKTLRYWDLRQQSPAHTQTLPDKCLALSVSHPLLVVGTGDRNIQIFNLAKPNVVYKQVQSPLKYQTRSIACFPDHVSFVHPTPWWSLVR
jgi:mRNA export factor